MERTQLSFDDTAERILDLAAEIEERTLQIRLLSAEDPAIFRELAGIHELRSPLFNDLVAALSYARCRRNI